MNTQAIANSDLNVTRIAYGCMPLGGSWDAAPLQPQTRQKAMAAVHAALDAGINFYDHADIYCRGKSEEVFADIWTEMPNLREKILVQSKCGIRFEGDPDPGFTQRFDFSYEHIMNSVEGSLKRLKTDYLDVLLLHRPDPLVEPEEVARAFDALHTAGKVRHFGVSNHTAAQIELLRKFVTRPLVFNQVELSIVHAHLFDEGVIFNQDMPNRPVRNHGTIEYCRQHDITLQAWAPLAKGRLSGAAKTGLSDVETKTAFVVADLAQQKNVGPEAILIAWILRHPARIQPVIGTTNPERIQACCQADGITLTREEWYRLYIAGRGERLP